MKKILVLGSTGSIGENTLNVIDTFPDHFKAVGLTAHSNIDLLERQIRKHNPESVVVSNPGKAQILKTKIADTKTAVYSGSDGLLEITKNSDYDILVTALVGFAGLAPTIEGIKRKKRIALANKETLVVAGEFIIDLCKQYDAEMIPVDSEHSAIFQSLVGEENKNISKLILTASGGPFFNREYNELQNVSVKDALNHPNWEMGAKITIDSASMMNKGLEVIEAKWMFNLSNDKIEVVIHPQSIIHSMVEFNDRSIKAQLSIPDMKLPIQYALTYPDRLESNFIETDFPKLHQLTFFEPDLEKFRCLKLAYEVMDQGGTAPCILNAANEFAVEKFLKGSIKFLEIPEIIDSALNKISNHHTPDLETIFECDRKTREFLETR
ncbi:MAG: 1-deoxy-D-xylulose-5-phosphate reductoisomerase [Melioribacteraceae bacterium]|nr:1-deoxy-D-xylulose-5-phosphate reductoisomerase [Melioribacteraceae bacterium]